MTNQSSQIRRWEGVNGIYQIYPRSFQDSNGDGVGDLNGVTARLDYLADKQNGLGVDAIWLSPFFTSPMKDFGYDVADYCDVDPIFGTLQDFDVLLAAAHARGLKIMIDYVPNHTSDKHAWFIESASSTANPKSDWYTWVDPKDDGGPPNNWLSVFGGSAWTWHDGRQQYYLHSFLPEQPDLNWENPKVRKAMLGVLRFWLERGVDGIRADAVRWMSKNPSLPDAPAHPDYDPQTWLDPYAQLLPVFSQNYDTLFDHLNEINDCIAEHEDRLVVFEHYPMGNDHHADQYAEFYSKIRQQIGGPFNLDGILIPFNPQIIQNFVSEYQLKVGQFHTMFYCLSNHDKPRLVARYGEKGARAMALLLLTLPGIPTIYNGDEIGMTDGPISPDQIRDPAEKRSSIAGLGRDPQRTPMQWEAGAGAGFTENDQPWLPINPDHVNVNLAEQKTNDTSFFALYQKLFSLRTNYSVLRDARSTLLIEDRYRIENNDVVQYQIEDTTALFTVYLNLSQDAILLPETNSEDRVVMATTETALHGVKGQITLGPCEAILLKRISKDND